LEAALDFGAGFLTAAGLTTLEEDLTTGPEVLRALLRGGILKRRPWWYVVKYSTISNVIKYELRGHGDDICIHSA
jgi:hypothetical protein